MRLHPVLPCVEPKRIAGLSGCRYEGCQGTRFRFHQSVKKPTRDTVHWEVTAHRYQCLRCGRTFRQTSQRVGRLTAPSHLLGLSYGAVSLTLEALGVYLSKTRVYEFLQAAAERVPALKRDQVFEGIRTSVLGSDVTSVKRNGRWLPLLLAAVI